MDIDIELKNYRCFPDEHLARFSLRPGFTALIGANNSGKSSLLKFLFEFRGLFEQINTDSGRLLAALTGSGQGVNLGGVYDSREIFSNTNDRDMEILLRVRDPDYVQDHRKPPPATAIEITLSRQNVWWTAKLRRDDESLHTKNQGVQYVGNILQIGGVPYADLDVLFNCCRALTRCVYVGPFRNAINIGGRDNYFDIQVGQQFIRT